MANKPELAETVSVVTLVLARCGAPAALVIVALFHLHQNLTAHLNPWLGGTFGMFSTNDRPWSQALSIEAEDAEGNRYFVAWAPDVAGAMSAARRDKLCSRPTRAALDEAAEHALHARRIGVSPLPKQVLASLAGAGLIERVRLRESRDDVEQIKILRVASASPADTSATPLAIRATARVWRLRFDGQTASFRTKPVGETGEAKITP